MNKYFSLTFLLLTLSLTAQDFNQAYLDSLPEEVRKSLEEKKDAEESIEEPVYRRASTSVDKEFNEDEKPEIYGSDFFDTLQSSFMPINEPNLDSSYVLDFGDILKIQIIGQKNSINSYQILRDGSINLPDIGKLILSGLSLDDASRLIKAKIKNSYIGTEAFVSLENIRDISILISGNAFNPGIYTLNGNSNMLHALNMAGGVNEFGSYRQIRLIRNGKVIDSLDIYQMLINGIHNLAYGLRTGDSIVVDSTQKVVSVESGVMRPGKYELLNTENFEDLLTYANGYSRNADLSNIQVKRINNGNSEIIKLDKSELENFEFFNNDAVFIREHKFKNINIQGAVKNPGNYMLTTNQTLSDLINMVGGYEDFAYPFGGYLQNRKALQINEEAKTKLYNKFLKNLILNASSIESDNIGLILEQIETAEVTGRIIAEFDIEVIKNNPELDTLLEDGDRIIIPNITQQVYIQGEISNPGAIRYSPGQDLNYYIQNAGGYLKSADVKNIFIIHPNGETQIFSNNTSLSFLKADTKNELVYPGSIIYIPQTTDLVNSLEVASIWAPIISSIALSLTSLSVLNNSN